MPLIVSLDECESALNAIAAYAKTGLENPEQQEAALEYISVVCDMTKETLSHTLPDGTSQLALLLSLDTEAERRGMAIHLLRYHLLTLFTPR